MRCPRNPCPRKPRSSPFPLTARLRQSPEVRSESDCRRVPFQILPFFVMPQCYAARISFSTQRPLHRTDQSSTTLAPVGCGFILSPYSTRADTSLNDVRKRDVDANRAWDTTLPADETEPFEGLHHLVHRWR
jgi:hypothetical protein